MSTHRFEHYKWKHAAIHATVEQAVEDGLLTKREENGKVFYKITEKGQAMRLELEKKEAAKKSPRH